MGSGCTIATDASGPAPCLPDRARRRPLRVVRAGSHACASTPYPRPHRAQGQRRTNAPRKRGCSMWCVQPTSWPRITIVVRERFPIIARCHPAGQADRRSTGAAAGGDSHGGWHAPYTGLCCSRSTTSARAGQGLLTAAWPLPWHFFILILQAYMSLGPPFGQFHETSFSAETDKQMNILAHCSRSHSSPSSRDPHIAFPQAPQRTMELHSRAELVPPCMARVPPSVQPSLGLPAWEALLVLGGHQRCELAQCSTV